MEKYDRTSIGEAYVSEHRRRKGWKRAIAVLSCFVTAGTLYALTMPAITLDRTAYGLEEHQHAPECFREERTLSCDAETLGIHRHTEGCLDGEGDIICGCADFVIHTHDSACFDENGELVCTLREVREHQHGEGCYQAAAETDMDAGHEHSDACYQWTCGEDPACGLEEDGDHTHESGCYAQIRGDLICTEAGADVPPVEEAPILICGKQEIAAHTHTDACFDETGSIACGLVEIRAHQHTEACFAVEGEPVLICDLPEHQHNEACDGIETPVEQISAEQPPAEQPPLEQIPSVEVSAEQIPAEQPPVEQPPAEQLPLEQPPVEQIPAEEVSAEQPPTEQLPVEEVSAEQIPDADPGIVAEALVILSGEDVSEAVPRRMATRPLAANEQTPGNIRNHLQEAEILVNGQPYDGQSELDPGEQFQVALKWELLRTDLTETLTYTYQIPEQIVVQDVAEAVLYDENNNRKGVYSIKDGVLAVTYDNVADVNTTTFKLNATWDQQQIGQETTVKWNDGLETLVKFDNSQVSAAKELLEQKDMPDGSLVGEYAVTVTAKSAINGITLTDTLTAEKFHFAEGYYEVDGQKYDYRIRQADGTYTYGSFVRSGDTVTFPAFDLPEGGQYTVEYGVKLDADDRFELDRYQTPTGLRNTATASYQSGEDTISTTVTVEDTYRAESKWLVKEQGDAVADDEAPWTIKINNAKAYDMGGAVIGDHIQTAGVTYKTDKPVSITGTAKDGSPTSYSPTWVTISDATVANIAGTSNAFDRLFDPNDADGQAAKRELEAAAGVTLTKENISNYVFVGQSSNQFIWFTPETGSPTSYEISYYTDTSGAGNAITNSASAGWKQWTVGDIVGGLIQEVNIKKENSGVRQDEGDYFVDWTITLEVPAHRGAIEDVYFYDTMPYHSESYGYDHLVGLSSGQIDLSKGEIAGDRIAQIKDMEYLSELTKNAFTVTSDSADVQQYLNEHSYTTLGHPIVGLVYDWPGAGRNFDVYDGGEVGQLEIIGADGTWFAGKRLSPAAFGIYLGDLPATDDTGYTITVNYTTKVDPVWADQLNGLGRGVNGIQLKQKVNDNMEVTLAEAYSEYWITHTKAQDTLDKNVVAFDPDTKILTYRVEIDPLADLIATPNATYQLKDVLNLPGATYVEDSFILSFHGSVDPTSNAFTWNSGQNAIIWRSDKSMKPTDYGITAAQAWFFHSDSTEAGSIKLDLSNNATASSEYTLSIPNPYNVLGLSAPEEKAGMLAPMSLTYQVKLPENAEEIGTGTLINNVSLYRQEGAKEPELLDGAQAEFDYSSALHKKLTATPNGENGYTATFTIDVDKTVKEWPKDLTSFTVQDDMSRSLTADVTSIHVYGHDENGQKVELTEGYTVSYDDQAADKNTLLITVSDQSYQRYQIVYDAKMSSDVVNDSVPISNTAFIQGTEIKSETVDRDIYVQEQDGSVVETNYQVKLLKFDAANTATRLEATFDLYAYENGEWVKKDHGIKTSAEDGTIILKNTDEKTILTKDTWYKLVETDPPKGYIASTTYFHLGQVSGNKPEGVGSFTTIPLEGGTHQIPNYKATLTLHKVDASDQKSLSGAEFALYEDAACTKEIGRLTEKSGGIHSFDLENLTAGTIYYLKETRAPAGYHLPGTVYTVTFDAEGKVTVQNEAGNVVSSVGNAYQIPNETSYALPNTGGAGAHWYPLCGLAMLLTAAVWTIWEKRKQREPSA